jgi:hypothetical protein
MTQLKRRVRREIPGPENRPPFIIQLEPPNLVRIKKKGSRKWFETSIEVIYWMAARKEAERMIAERKEKRKR